MVVKDVNFRPENKFVAVGPTFQSHQKETERKPRWPDVWIVPNESVIHENEEIRIPNSVENVKPGVELTAVVGSEIWQTSRENAWKNIDGFTISNDVTVTSEWPGWPEVGRMKTNFGYKMFPTFSPVLSKYQEKKELKHYKDLEMIAEVDGKTSIKGNSSDLCFDIPGIISYISHMFPLNEGDLVALGDPGDADIFLDEAEEVRCSIETVGEITNNIKRTEVPKAPFR